MSKHANALELAQERIADLDARAQEVWSDLSWRAKRYAMNGDGRGHDVMHEALIAFLDYTKPLGYVPEMVVPK